MNARMIFFEMDLLVEEPGLQLVLAAYHAEEQAAAEAAAEAKKDAKKAAAVAEPEVVIQPECGEHPEAGEQPDDCECPDDVSVPKVPAKAPTDDFAESRWIARIMDVEGVPEDETSSMHGQLMAHGLLKFKLLGRDGMGYQLTSLGRRGALFCPKQEPTDEEDETSAVVEDSEAA